MSKSGKVGTDNFVCVPRLEVGGADVLDSAVHCQGEGESARSIRGSAGEREAEKKERCRVETVDRAHEMYTGECKVRNYMCERG